MHRQNGQTDRLDKQIKLDRRTKREAGRLEAGKFNYPYRIEGKRIQTYIHTNRQIGRHTDLQTGTQADIQTDSQAHRHTDRWACVKTGRQTGMCSDKCARVLTGRHVCKQVGMCADR